ncbi:MAG: M23 family metallopeptidase [Kiritimatiellaeota bacterium]|nr:M23 family metallopeptidase [Kiritimatiellota bacterium]
MKIPRLLFFVLPAAALAQSAGLVFRPPTGQLTLDGSITTNVFMHTGTGRPESGMYGGVRVDNNNQPRHHGGIDIAPLKRDRRGAALDTVHAIAEGRVAYVNSRPGASNYGNYVVLLHRDPAFGDFYSLYAHLASTAAGLAAGQSVVAGHLLGVMGNTPDIPLARSHLHLETGLVINSRYADFAASRKNANEHGNWNGLALQGFNPCDLYARLDAGGRFDVPAHLASLPSAFRVVVHAARPVDYFKRHPSLWRGVAPATENFPMWLVIDFSAEGIPLAARPASPSESLAGTTRVTGVNEQANDRNARRLLAKNKSGEWTLSTTGADWLALLLW